MSRLPADAYSIVACYAGDRLAEATPDPYPAAASALPDASHAVYICVDADGVVDYVGSVARSDDGGLRARFAEHLRTKPRARYWTAIHVVALSPDTATVDVRTIEGRIGSHLQPAGNHRLPRPRAA